MFNTIFFVDFSINLNFLIFNYIYILTTLKYNYFIIKLFLIFICEH